MPLSIGVHLWKKVTITKLQRLRSRGIIRSNSGSNNSGKSVRFSDSGSSIHYTYGSSDYDRGSNDYDEFDIGHYLRTEEDGPMITAVDQYDHSTENDDDDTDSLTEEDLVWAEQVRRNTKVNMKRGHHSVAVLIQYRANI